MADFSANATQLSGPQGLGSNQVTPVTANPTAGILDALNSTVSIFARGAGMKSKEEAEKRKQEVVSKYVKDQVAINQAVASGQINAAEASSRSRSVFNQYAAGYSEYIGDIESAGKALRGFTEAGEVEKKVASEQKMRDDDITIARNRGYTFIPGMTKQQEDAQIEAAKTAIRAENEMATFIKQQNELREQGRYNQQVSERQAKELSVKLINDIGGSSLQAFQQLGVSLGDQVASGSITPDRALAMLTERFSNINSGIVAAAGSNPEMASAYRGVFNDIYQASQKLIDPKQRSEDVKAQLESIIAKASIMAVTRNPRVLAATATNRLMPMNPAVALATQQAALESYSLLATSSMNDITTPQVVGNPELESDVLKLASAALKDLQGGKIKKDEVTAAQAGNTVNNILAQTGSLLDKGVKPEQLKGVASFFASPEYGKYVQEGKVDAQANQAAKKVLQLMYEPVIKNGIEAKLNSYLYGQAAFGKKQKAPTSLGDAVNIQFTGSGISFIPRQVEGLDPVEQASQRASIKELEVAQKAVNQMIHIGAHMEGTVDYKKYWEDNKHILMPSLYQTPGLSVGTQKQGKDGTYEYIGGPELSKSSWKRVK